MPQSLFQFAWKSLQRCFQRYWVKHIFKDILEDVEHSVVQSCLYSARHFPHSRSSCRGFIDLRSISNPSIDKFHEISNDYNRRPDIVSFALETQLWLLDTLEVLSRDYFLTSNNFPMAVMEANGWNSFFFSINTHDSIRFEPSRNGTIGPDVLSSRFLSKISLMRPYPAVVSRTRDT